MYCDQDKFKAVEGIQEYSFLTYIYCKGTKANKNNKFYLNTTGLRYNCVFNIKMFKKNYSTTVNMNIAHFNVYLA